ncbi:hypothetical protein ACWD4N_29770 [Streptomyces sp. NPDC002586]
MTSENSVRRHIISLGIFAVSVLLAVVIGQQLTSYGVPLLLMLACTTACMTSFMAFLFQVVEALATTTHRCRQPGCDFRVRLTNVDAGENRRWQEIAATHPHHTD